MLFGIACAMSATSARGEVTLRISVQEDPEVIRLRVEGRLAGAYTSELDRAWRSLALALGSKMLCVDLCDVTYMDRAGMQLLAEIHCKTNADLVADTPLTKYFAEEARRRSWKVKKQEK
jgi:ABC-type transporter Mla MlaB component